jgi:hypothetical protein
MNKRLIDSETSSYWVTAKDFKQAINEARKEAVQECLRHYVPDGNPQVWRDKIIGILKSIK